MGKKMVSPAGTCSSTRPSIPLRGSVGLPHRTHLPPESLIVVGTEHRLADKESLEAMLRAVEHRNR